MTVITKIILYIFIISGFACFICFSRKIWNYRKKNTIQDFDEAKQGYIIKHINQAPILMPFALLNIAVMVMLLDLKRKDLVATANEQTELVASIILYVFLIGSEVFFLVYSLYTMQWEIQVLGDTIIHTNWRGKKRKYLFSDITKCVTNHFDTFSVYSGEKRLFILEFSESFIFREHVLLLGIPIENKRKMTMDNHVVHPLTIIPVLFLLAGCFSVFLGINIILEGKSGLIMPGIAIGIAVFCLFATVYYQLLCRFEVQGDYISCWKFLKKKKYNIHEITEVRQEKTKFGTEYYVFYAKKERLFKMQNAPFMTGMALFEQRMMKEKIRWKK